jgi:O-methyltransferase
MLKNLLASLFSAPPPSAHVPAAESPITGAYTFAADGLQTVHNAGFLNEARFRESYALGANSGHRICAPEDLHIEWRVYICCWAAQHALKLRGDFVECGVSTGIVSRAVAHYVNFGQQQKRYWLIDTFDGIPLQQATAAELPLAQSKNNRHYYDCHQDVKQHFSRYGNVEVIKGRVPEILDTLDIPAVAFLHIDMNIAEPEVQAIRHFWDKLTPGAAVVFDDYASMAHQAQKAALDDFAASRGLAILSLPTGQGLALKN